MLMDAGASRTLRWLAIGLTALGLIGGIYALVTGRADGLPAIAAVWLILWLTVSIAAGLWLAYLGELVPGFLVGLLAMLVGWRIAGTYLVGPVVWPLLLAFVAYVAAFLSAAAHDRRAPGPAMSLVEWHLTFVRIYIGFDMVPHFTEKLFAGPGPFGEDVAVFASLGVPFPMGFVVLAGLCELGIAIGIGLGVLTRLAAPCAVLYILIATVLGGHFDLGFIWASPGGGWEYPVLMMVLFGSFVVTGGGRFSIDHALAGWSGLPPRLRLFMSKPPAAPATT